MTLRKIFTCALLSCVLAACGTTPKPGPQASYPTVRVYVQHPQNLGMLPLRVAERLGFFSQQHINVDWVSTPNDAPLRVENAGVHYPIDGLVMEKPDLLLVSPLPDPHFRLYSLNHLPMVYARSEAAWVPYLKAVLVQHHVIPTTLTALGISQIKEHWQQNTLPWVVVSLTEYYQLRHVVPHTTILAFLGAATGPIPVTVITGVNKNALAFVSAINLALWYLYTTKPDVIASLLSPSTPTTGRILAQALHYHYWPNTVVITQSLYQRGQSLFGTAKSWPSYATSVNVKLAQAALTHWPA